jgi:Secretion system C-terminal sorting domain
MKKHVLITASLVFAGLALQAQSTCNNRDFEDTTFVGWSGGTALNYNGILTPVTWTPGMISNGNNAAVSDPNGRHTIITQNSIDPIVLDPITMLPDTQMTTLAPNGGFGSVRLGNNIMNYEMERITYQFPVTAGNDYFQFQFASVMEDPGHQWDYQPYFMVNFYDQSNNLLTCCSDTIWAGDTTVPYIVAGNTPQIILYRRWTPISVNFNAYIGQTLTVEFINADCGYGGHFGYTYLDVSCMGTGIPNVWPGDCDYDLQANNVDLLTLGVTYGSTGPVRAGASNSWTPQVSADWTQAVPLGANYKHSDCNGDGIVDLNDTLAISLNYSQTHPFRYEPGNNADFMTVGNYYLVPQQDTVGPLNVAYVDIYAGSSAQPVNDFYGSAFSLSYNNSLVQPNTVSTNVNNSWMGTKNVSTITMTHDNYNAGSHDVGITRFTHTEVNGYGYVGTMKLSTANVTSMQSLEIGIGGIKTVNSNGVAMPMTGTGCQIVIDPNMPSGIVEPQVNHVEVYPNPANETVSVRTDASDVIEITNTLGQVVYSQRATSNVTSIDLTEFNSGIYFVNVYTVNGKVTQQLMVE